MWNSSNFCNKDFNIWDFLTEKARGYTLDLEIYIWWDYNIWDAPFMIQDSIFYNSH